ncbi:ABC transporter ATP-binding protein [Halogeometricum sp. CBA1124]|uniref:ABC transporter ATP-binding protein n=1 Tax=Halogeometricum sp. CBA1124 TaxID=2668071 RepID=UPI00142B7CD5|nr:ABC transporter ATP-binding protein [Halogeometricum sp. CBA1124]MUV56833.1 ATP-binding cassette domain-containing protein [Halogeometricum sp. CBA1124]
MSLLEIEDLHVHFHTEEGRVEAINGVNLTVGRDEVLGVIGESGCGKTVTMLSVIGLLQTPPAEVVQGSVRFDGEELLSMSESELDQIRGDDISMIYQDPMSSLNPVLTIGRQLTEPLLAHRDISKAAARERAIEMLDDCGLADAERIMGEYPHELSGGMRQRVMIAMALITEPKLLLADEPTTALDVTIQAQIMDLLRDLRTDFDTSIVFITHDLPVVSEIADRIAVMYAGRVAETCSVDDLFDSPLHPYTRRLVESIPSLEGTPGRLSVIEGSVPNLLDPPQGCPFASRCPESHGEPCQSTVPELASVGEDQHGVACHLYTDVSAESPPWNVPDEVAEQREWGQ